MNESFPLGTYLPPEKPDLNAVKSALLDALRKADNVSAEADLVFEHLLQHFQQVCPYEELLNIVKPEQQKSVYKSTYRKKCLTMCLSEIRTAMAEVLDEHDCQIVTFIRSGISLRFRDRR